MVEPTSGDHGEAIKVGNRRLGKEGSQELGKHQSGFNPGIRLFLAYIA